MSLLLSTGAFASSLSGVPAPGMVLMLPTSVAYTGSSATLGANGQVTYSAVTDVSVNGCFTADFDTYVVSVRSTCTSGNTSLSMRLRSSGSDNSTASSYRNNMVIADGTAEQALEYIQDLARLTTQSSVGTEGTLITLYRPFVSGPTAQRTTNVNSKDGGRINDTAGNHTVSASYDGFTFIIGDPFSTMSGAIQVYGVRS